MKSYVSVIAFAVVAGAACWFFGLNIVFALVVVLVVGAAGVLLVVLVPSATRDDWPTAPPPRSDGARRETYELSWALRTRSGVVDDAVIRRVHAIAAGRLAHHHVDLDDPADHEAAQRLLGADVYDLVHAAGRKRVRLASVLGALDRIEGLDRTSAGTTSQRRKNA